MKDGFWRFLFITWQCWCLSDENRFSELPKYANNSSRKKINSAEYWHKKIASFFYKYFFRKFWRLFYAGEYRISTKSRQFQNVIRKILEEVSTNLLSHINVIIKVLLIILIVILIYFFFFVSGINVVFMFQTAVKELSAIPKFGWQWLQL